MPVEVDLRFDKGTILVKGIKVPNSTWDERTQSFRALAMYYKDIRDYLILSRINFANYALDLIPCPELQTDITLRDYQQQALASWERNGRRGVIVLPTGSGKTIIGIKAIALLNTPVLVICPTLDLVYQWRAKLKEVFNTEIGMLGGGEVAVNRITWSTIQEPYVMHEVCKIIDADRMFRSVVFLLPLNLGGIPIGKAIPIYIGTEIKTDNLPELIDSFETLHARVNGKNEVFYGSYDMEIGIDRRALSDLELAVNNILKMQSPMIPCFAADEFLPYAVSDADNLDVADFRIFEEHLEPFADPYVSGKYA
jgi:hypothetical protein